ncbi:alanine racemase [Allofrancisella guangzhouensis]|uniref:Alanine racemase n=1 Tax=Allofrancisella guangzhouensis TaxID=594679 RepID=A0A0A8E9N4_9GAMM|nr:alanine racemase [Allofrancisella guangzhouensis]AJC48881.1 alanine racemase [Allofrancisella guangzhouensis]MBK2027422.1 alanine racemase [Allofrancisella guangzhouensis]MBK2043408.1 alanine racemase [Allofrancisella guangzhouensis]MBK2045833.1 alanine racemase [Allofrancisella guangzhouensis]
MNVNVLEVNINTLRNNILAIKKYTGTKFCLPVKANAYGHGLEIIVKNTKDIVDFYATACASEALGVYKNSDNVPILIFGAVEQETIQELADKNIRFSIHDLDDIQKLEKYAKRYSKKLKAHLFVNTGMNMLGVDYDEALEIILRVFESEYIFLEGVYSHLACADIKDHFFNKLQSEKFEAIVKHVKSLDPNIICHFANSYGSIGQNGIFYDMVRPGILSYGFLPEFEVADSLKIIKPVAKLYTQVIKVIKLSEASYVGYSISYKGSDDEFIAILPIGYGDGFSRQLGGKGSVYINQKKYPIVGRVNMDALAVSLGRNDCDIKVGAKVELISDLPQKENSVRKLAKLLHTIEYEVVTTLNQRVIRHEYL